VTIAASMLVCALAVQAREAQPPPAATASETSLSGLPVRLAHDARRLVTTRTPALILAGGTVAAAAVHPADQRTVTRLSTSTGADLFFDAGSEAGDGFVQGGAAIAVYTVGLASQNERVRQLGTGLVEAQVINFFITQGTKVIAARTRPDGGRYSFPSGHASATFVTADVLMQQLGWRIGIPAYVGATYVAISRVSEKQHYLSDVVFGAAVGVASARTLSVNTRRHAFTIMPSPRRGGAAIFVTATPR
jgi:membrane-associated phospholipid phosphatase